MDFSKYKSFDIRDWSLRFSSLFFLVLMSKFYFLWGMQEGGKNPAAPLVVVLMRDILYYSFLFFCLWSVNLTNLLSLFLKKFKTEALFLSLFVIICWLQWDGPKSTKEFVQHYLRNFLGSALAYFVFSIFLEKTINTRQVIARAIEKPLVLFAGLSITMSILQLIFFPYMMWERRPTGFLGDPLLNSCFILIGLWLGRSRIKQLSIRWIFLAFGAFVVYQAASLSALLAFFLAIIIEKFTATNFQALLKDKSFIKKAALSFVIGGIITLVTLSGPRSLERDSPLEKINSFWHTLTCEENCTQVDPSIRGRLMSYQVAYDFCLASPAQCLMGNRDSSKFLRVDSIISALILNFGLIFTVFYFYLFFVKPMAVLIVRPETRQGIFAIIFYVYWIFGLFNSSIYKYPLNIIFYISVCMILWDKKEKSL
jgi:hypothetical protein